MYSDVFLHTNEKKRILMHFCLEYQIQLTFMRASIDIITKHISIF